ncbi:hypothetical protein DY000_02032275 [Brassica cretica]|uniref:Uncharacterized protein n=1 Tax=Brassica cretica TaxID=69181 RepID=A0ABQ7DDP3_BRACR|nr:hypothetical protein DY000_02032275 [Brassica cretica]
MSTTPTQLFRTLDRVFMRDTILARRQRKSFRGLYGSVAHKRLSKRNPTTYGLLF